MKIYDLSIPIKTGMTIWPGDPGIAIDIKTTVAKHGVGLSKFQVTSHSGTHVDAPSHFLDNGKTLDEIPLEKFVGPCKVLDLMKTNEQQIPASSFTKFKIDKGDRLLLKTGNYKLLKGPFTAHYKSLSLEAAKYLVSKKINLVGIDYYGIEKKSAPGHPVHKALLSAEIVIIEGLDLSKITPGNYNLYCLPMNVIGVDGAPARVILIQK